MYPTPHSGFVRCAVTLFIATALTLPLAAQARHDTTIVLATPGAAARIAAVQSADVAAAGFRTEQARARIGEERADLWPSVSLQLSDGRRTFNTAAFGLDFPTAPGEPPLFDPDGQVEGPVRGVDLRGRLAVPLLDLPAMARVRTAQANHRTATVATTRSADVAALTGAQRFLLAVRARALVGAREADSVLAADLLGIARDQRAAGVGVGLDVTRAEAQVAAVHAQLIGARANRDRTRLELARSLGLPLDADLVLPDSLPSASISAAGVSVSAALQQRADLQVAEREIDAAERDAAAIRAERLPTVAAFVDDGQTGLDYGRWLNTYNYGVQVVMPLFDGFHRRHRLDEQRAVIGELEVRRRDLAEQVALEVRSAELDLAAAADQAQAVHEELRLAELEVAQARERFAVGVSGNADIVTAALHLNQVRTRLIDARAAAQAANASLAAATGTIRALP